MDLRELDAPYARNAGYVGFPILDGAAPAPEALYAMVSSLRPGRTFVHCAQGHGRTGLVALAVLVMRGAVGSVEEGLRMLAAARPGIRLNRQQLDCVRDYAEIVKRPASHPLAGPTMKK